MYPCAKTWYWVFVQGLSIRKCRIEVLFEFGMYIGSGIEQDTVAKLLRSSFTEVNNKGFNVITLMQLGLEVDSCSFQKEMQMILSLPSASFTFSWS